MRITDCLKEDYVNQTRYQQLLAERESIHKLFGSEKEKNDTDTYTSTDNLQWCDTLMYANYTKVTKSDKLCISQKEIWDYLINYKGDIWDGKVYMNGMTIDASQIEKIDNSYFQPLEAENNILKLTSGTYYGITTNDGGETRTWGFARLR